MWSWERGRRIHGKMETELGKGGASFGHGGYITGNSRKSINLYVYTLKTRI